MKTKTALSFVCGGLVLFVAAISVSATFGRTSFDASLHESAIPANLPDLIVESATFSSVRAVVLVKNVGSGPSPKVDLLLEILANMDSASPVTAKLNKVVPPLAAGTHHKIVFDSGSFTFANHARRLIVDDTKLVTESNERNNAFFSNTFAVESPGDFPESGAADLFLSDAKFIAPSTVHFCVKNIGLQTSSSYKVTITIFSGPKKGPVWGGEGPNSKNPFSLPGNALKPGEVACNSVTFPTYSGSALEGRGRLVEIVSDNPLLDSDKSNNSLFSGGNEGLWHQ